VIGYLSGTSEGAIADATEAFRQGLGEQDFIEGRNVQFLYRFADSRYERLPALAADLTHRRVAVIATTGGPAAHLTAKAATTEVPIVFVTGSDPVEIGLVPRLNRPGGNVTGVTFLSVDLFAKRLEMLREIVPSVTLVGHLVNSAGPTTDADTRRAESAARALRLNLVTVKASSPDEIEQAFATLVGEHVGGFLESADAFFSAQRNQIAALTIRYKLPAVFHRLQFVEEAGGLMSYGASFSDAWRLAGNYTGRILKGEKPADLPVQQSAKVELIINLKTAKTLGLTLPQTLLARADRVIE
jgi:putative ABC transport system substrate-binding protein